MFAGSGWELLESSGQPPLVQHPADPDQRFSIVRVNEFDHARRTMSVVALDLSTGELHVFCKVWAVGGSCLGSNCMHTMQVVRDPTAYTLCKFDYIGILLVLASSTSSTLLSHSMSAADGERVLRLVATTFDGTLAIGHTGI